MLEWWGNHKKESPSQFLQKSAVCHSVISYECYNRAHQGGDKKAPPLATHAPMV